MTPERDIVIIAKLFDKLQSLVVVVKVGKALSEAVVRQEQKYLLRSLRRLIRTTKLDQTLIVSTPEISSAVRIMTVSIAARPTFDQIRRDGIRAKTNQSGC
jgi:hypothetical protein